MKAILVREFGTADRLVIEDRPIPGPRPGEVTIDVAFAGVGFVDTLVRSGAFAFANPPLTPGIEVSGTVRALGEGVGHLAIGQRVAALLTDFTDGGMGGYAAVARAKAALTISLTDDDDLATAAATIVNGATAFLAMEGIARGASVAISGASGGLGQSLIVAAAHHAAGTIVAITGRPEREAGLRQLGATLIASLGAFATADEPFDAAFDTVGGDVRMQMLRRLQTAGRLVLLGDASGQDIPLSGDDIWLRSLKVEGLATGGLSALTPAPIAAAAQTAIAAARLHPVAFATLDLDQAAEAHQMLETRQGPGKFVLRVA